MIIYYKYLYFCTIDFMILIFNYLQSTKKVQIQYEKVQIVQKMKNSFSTTLKKVQTCFSGLYRI